LASRWLLMARLRDSVRSPDALPPVAEPLTAPDDAVRRGRATARPAPAPPACAILGCVSGESDALAERPVLREALEAARRGAALAPPRALPPRALLLPRDDDDEGAAEPGLVKCGT